MVATLLFLLNAGFIYFLVFGSQGFLLSWLWEKTSRVGGV